MPNNWPRRRKRRFCRKRLAMGNSSRPQQQSPARPATAPVSGQRPAPSRSAPPQQVFGLRTKLPHAPRVVALSYNCPKCKHSCFDGNFAKQLVCDCGTSLLRAESGDICILETKPQVTTFDDLFTVRLQYPPSTQMPTLFSVSFGVFEDTLPARFKQNSIVNWDLVLNEVLLFFFAQKQRCVGINDVMQVSGIRLKVTGALPAYGVVGKDTSVQCYETMNTAALRRVLIEAVDPHPLTEAIFQSTVLPYLRTHRIAHLHTGQYLHLPSIELLIASAEPPDGLLTPNTEVYFDTRPIRLIREVSVVYQRDRMPQRYSNLPNGSLESMLGEQVLRAFLEGRHRVVKKGMETTVGGVWFRVNHCMPSFGYATEQCQLHLAEHQANNPGPRVIIRTSDGRVLMAEDPRVQMMQQLMQLLQAAGHHHESTNEDVLSALPTQSLQVLPQGDEASKCMICITDYSLGEEVTTLPCCKLYAVHLFHTPCIHEWLERSQLCPICKTNIQESLQGEQ